MAEHLNRRMFIASGLALLAADALTKNSSASSPLDGLTHLLYGEELPPQLVLYPRYRKPQNISETQVSEGSSQEYLPHIYEDPYYDLSSVLDVGIYFIPRVHDPRHPGVDPNGESVVGQATQRSTNFYNRIIATSRWGYLTKSVMGDKFIEDYADIGEIDEEIKGKITVQMPKSTTHIIRHTYVGGSLIELSKTYLWTHLGGGVYDNGEGFVVDAYYFATMVPEGYSFGQIRAALGDAFGCNINYPWADSQINPSHNPNFGNVFGNLFYRGYGFGDRTLTLDRMYIMSEQLRQLGAPYPQVRLPFVAE